MQPPPLSSDVALFLDFDGTLVDIASRPDMVMVPERLVGTLRGVDVLLDGALAIVSGRALADVGAFLAPLHFAGAGSHGMEIRLRDGHTAQAAPEIAEIAKQIAEKLKAASEGHAGLLSENKVWSATLHYRNAPALEAFCIAAAEAAIAPFPGWEIIRGKMVVEARPAHISKGTAVETFMQNAPFKGRMPVFVGDDVTDEDGMRAAISLGGYGIKVGDGDSSARFRLHDPAAVLRYLEMALH